MPTSHEIGCRSRISQTCDAGWQTLDMDHATRADLSSEVFGTLARLVHSTSQEVLSILRTEGLNPAQFQLLRAVADSPGITQADLMRRKGVSAGSVSLLVAKVEPAGLLSREADGAAKRLTLTPRGAKLVARLTPAQDEFFAELFGALSDRELKQLSALSERALHGLPWGQ